MQRKAFTLIELMVVVAVIAILATLAISNFSAAIRRARNAGRQSAIQAAAKGMETCYDVPSGMYTGLPANTPDGTEFILTTSATGPFSADENKCINESVVPAMENYPYYYRVRTTEQPWAFVLCAQLEEVPNWHSVGNVADLTTISFDDDINAFDIDVEGCDPEAASGSLCYFCVTNQQ